MVPFDDVDGPEMRLLPLAHARLGDAITGDPAHGRVRGLYRMTWTQNQMLFNRAAGGLRALRDAGIETMLLKGAPLSMLHYGSAALRPMADVDVLVPPGRAEAAMGVLREAGWRPSHEPAEEVIRAHHSHAFHHGAVGQIDLHWFSLWQSGDDGPLWDAARPMELAGEMSLAPCAADLLLIVCAHGAPREPEPAFRWIADAAAACEGDGVDWNRLEAEARRRRLTVTAAATLAYLAREFSVPVPEGVLRRLGAAGAPAWERLAFRAQVGGPGALRTGALLAERHHRLRQLPEIAPWHPGFLEFAGSVWGFDRRRDLVAHGLSRIGGDLGGRAAAMRRRLAALR